MKSELACLSCAYRKTDIFSLFLKSVPSDVFLLVVGDEENKTIWNDRKGEYAVYPNEPLGAKWNYGLSLLKNISFDYLVILGSDDFLSKDLWDYYRSLDVHYAGILDLYFMDWKTKRVKYNSGFSRNRTGEPHGAGRVLHRNVLDALGWKLWEDDLGIGLDGAMTENLRKLQGLTTKFIRVADHDFVALDIKTAENLHSISEYDGEFLADPEPVLNRLGWTLSA